MREASAEHARARRAIDAHFAGRGSAAHAALLRGHVSTCESCRRRFERQLLLARLDPRAVPEEARVAASLGIAGRRPRRTWTVAIACAAAATLFVVAPRAPRPRAGEPVARGAGDAAPSLLVYRVGADGTPARVVGGSIRRDDELAFAYTNPAGRAYLLVFGTDEHGHVYWYHPGWPIGAAAPPAAIEARRGLGPHELPEAIRHDLDGHRLRVTAVLTDTRLDAAVVERDGRALPFPPAGAGNAQVIERTFEVTP